MRNTLLVFAWVAGALVGQRPIEYRLDVKIDPAQATFTGVAKIQVELEEATERVRLHALDLTIGGVKVAGRAATFRAVEDEQIEIAFAKARGRVWFEIEYTALLREDAQLGAYRRKAGQSDWYAFTTFTPIEARRAFPCFDEPRFKTPWTLTLRVPEKLLAAGNAPSLSEKTGDGWKTVRFEKTGLLPTEVVAFTVGPWETAEGPRAGKKAVPTRVLYPRGEGGDPAEALKAAAEMIGRLEEYTGIAYPWAKLDQLALLANAYGAVENPGLITYRKDILLPKPDRVTAMRGTVAHELAHQWFGNLVTQESWEDVWLSEGFATFLGAKMRDLDLPPEGRGLRAIEQRNAMLKRDASEKTRAVRVKKSRREEMKDVYGPEVYQKAASVLLMLEGWLGEEVFRNGLRKYLRQHANGNASFVDFVKAMNSAAGRDVDAVLSTYLKGTGVPKIAVMMECEGDSAKVRVTGAKGWTTPVCVRTPAGKSCAVVGDQGTIAVADKGCPAWLVPNAGGTGYFSVENDGKAPLTPMERLALTAQN